MSDLSKIDVVALDAEQASRVDLYKALYSAGVRRIRLATSVDHALALVDSQRPDIVLAADGPSNRGWLRLATTLKDRAAPKEKADDGDRYGLDGAAAMGFAGDLDELLGDGPKAGTGQAAPQSAGPMPFVLATTKPTRELVENARSLGINAVVMRPIVAAGLAQRLKSVLRQTDPNTMWQID